VRGGVELPPGVHRLRASRDGFEPQLVDVVVTARASTSPTLGTWRRHGWSLVSDLERWDATTSADRRRVARAITEKLSDFGLRAMETFESGGARHEVAIFVHRPTGLEFVLVPGGSFAMGSAPSEDGRRPDERRHGARVGPFLMARTPVTQAAWEAQSFPNLSYFRGPSLPADHVSHDEATRFCAASGLALPTEAQWEYACRAGFDGPWCCGVDPAELSGYAWFAGNAGDGPRPVGGRKPTAFGLFDMHGNVWEWCADRYSEYPFDGDEAAAPVAADAAAGDFRVFRGGGWLDPSERVRAAQRSAFRADYRSFDLGVRPVRTLTPELVAERPGAEGARERTTTTTWNRGAAPRTSPAAPADDPLAPLTEVGRWDAATSAERRRAADEVAAREPAFSVVALTTFEAGGTRHEIAVYLHAPTQMEFVLVPGGAFVRPETPSIASKTAEVAAAVQIAPFLFARTPVTQAAWRRTMGVNPSCFVGDRLPVEKVDLDEATAFCARLGLQIPTEEQWEFACRAGTTTPWCCGDETALADFAWYEKNAARSTHPVGEKRPNAFGLFDIVGNVWEWCRPDVDAVGREARIRGGAWTSDAQQLDSSRRLSYPAGTRMGILGFRPLRALGSTTEPRR
jgi:formylglycine-generating enzyme required for sulfatase activity